MRPVLLVAVALLAAPAAVQPADAALAPLDLLAEASLPGSGSFGLRVDSAGAAPYVVTLSTFGPFAGGSTSSIGVFLLDETKTLLFGFGVAGHLSPERTIVKVPVALPDLPPPDDVHVEASEAGGATACPYSCLYVTITPPATPSTRYLALWGARLGATEVKVEGAAGTKVAVATGSALALGDPEIVAALANVQAQKGVAGGHGAGAKVIARAAFPLAVEDGLFGFWGFNNVKFACQFGPASLCVGPGAADGVAPVTRLSWNGPAGAGSGKNVYAYSAAPPGTYLFNTDLKADAYGTVGAYVAQTGTLLVPYENYSFLTVADVALPG